MMQTMRASAKWIMGILAVAFVGWMVFDVGMDVGGRGTGVQLTDAVVRVNGTNIDLQTYYAALRDAQERQRQQYGTAPITLEDQRALQDAVMENLIQSVLLQQEFRRRNIGVTEAEIVQAANTAPPPEIMQAPDFQTDGQFDLQKYQRFLATTSDPTFLMALEARYRDDIPRIKLFEQLTADIYVSDAELWQRYRDQHDTVEVRLLEIRPQAVVPDSEVTVTDEDVRRYYRENHTEFERPAVAYMSYVSVSRVPNAADSAAALERAESIKAEIDGGVAFEDVALRESADSTSRMNGGDLGMQANERFVPEFTEAARALRPGDVSDPIQTQYGYHIIQLERRTADSLQARHILIPIELTGEHLDLVDARADTLDLYGAEQTELGALEDVAEMLGAQIAQAAPVTEGNRVFAEGQIVPDAGMWAFDALAGETSPVIESDRAFFLFRLDSLQEEGVPALESIQAAVRRAAIDAKKWDRARELADSIAQDLRAGQPLMDAALQNLLNARALGPMTRANPHPALRNAPKVVGAAFGLGVGEASEPIESEVAIYLVEPAAKQLADSAAFAEQLEDQRNRYLQAAQQERIQRFMLSLRSAADVVDRRRDIERLQRELADMETNNPFNPLGF